MEKDKKVIGVKIDSKLIQNTFDCMRACNHAEMQEALKLFPTCAVAALISMCSFIIMEAPELHHHCGDNTHYHGESLQ